MVFVKIRIDLCDPIIAEQFDAFTHALAMTLKKDQLLLCYCLKMSDTVRHCYLCDEAYESLISYGKFLLPLEFVFIDPATLIAVGATRVFYTDILNRVN